MDVEAHALRARADVLWLADVGCVHLCAEAPVTDCPKCADVRDHLAAEHALRVQIERERLETARQAARLLEENLRLREALADIARGDYSDPLCQRTPEQRAREALASKP